ncbi:MAG: NAD(P)-dependent oxidoreductase [Proteobacteria bacterium]|nr:MAG: NAD(P)-dependent oxidoreductase [Pseudomonadota bacterium]
MDAHANMIITGCGGFLGRKLVLAAQESLGAKNVLGIPGRSQGGPSLDEAGALVSYIRTQDFEIYRGTILIHAASEILFNDLNSSIRNIRASLNLIDFASIFDLQRIVFISSVAALQKNSGLTDWSHHQSFDSVYGASKAVGELCFTHLRPNAAVLNIRLGGVVGVQDSPSMFWNKLLKSAATKTYDHFSVDRLRSYRNFVSVNDAASAVVHLAQTDVVGNHTLSSFEKISAGEFVKCLTSLRPGLQISIKDDGFEDHTIHPPSSVFENYLQPLLPQIVKLIDGFEADANRHSL